MPLSANINFVSRPDASILIVDDAPSNLGVLRKLMADQGYQTFVATSGERAINLARTIHPDLILLDVVMPGMDGLETCRQLKEHPSTQRIPVIFMSARNDTDDVVAGFDIGAVDYIGKPLRMAEVCARVRAQLRAHTTSVTQHEQAERVRTIVDSMAEGLMIIEASGRIQYANPACARHLRCNPEAIEKKTLADLLLPQVAQEYLDYFTRCANNPESAPPPGAREVIIHRGDGSMRAMDLTLAPMVMHETLFIGLLHDITHHKQSETALQAAAMLDPLTKIANRRHFDSFVEMEWQRAIRSGEPLSLVVLDVDHFKLYNDTLGHPAGDLALQKVASVLKEHTPRATDMAARYGGEEFVLLFAETAANGAAVLAEAIRGHVEALRMAHPRSTTSDWLTVSIGVATIAPTQLDDLEQLFIAADRAMYTAKESGRNRVVAVDTSTSAWGAIKPLVMR